MPIKESAKNKGLPICPTVAAILYCKIDSSLIFFILSEHLKPYCGH
jgi:hypothetical protein